jgi:hypothetical protein
MRPRLIEGQDFECSSDALEIVEHTKVSLPSNFDSYCCMKDFIRQLSSTLDLRPAPVQRLPLPRYSHSELDSAGDVLAL